LRSISGWNVDLLYRQPDFAASGRVPSHHPSARIVDVQVLKEKPVTSPAAGRDKVAHRLVAMCTQVDYAAGTICVNAPSVASKPGNTTSNDVAWRAWLRAQAEDVAASRMENCIGQLDVHA
jgi:hypothetical protein